MKKGLYLLDIDLSLFDGAAAAPAATSGSDGGMGNTAGDSQQQTLPTRKGKKSGELNNVVYGKQPKADNADDDQSSAAGSKETETGTGSVTSDTLEAKRAEFQKLIKGEFKDLYTEETQNLINRRFAETKNLEKQLASANPVLDRLMAKYGVSDIEDLNKAIDNDEEYWQAEAEKHGMDVNAYREYEKTIRENARLKAVEENRQQQSLAQQQVAKWIQDAEAMKASGYPDFDLNAEFENPEFERLLKSGIPVQHAYEVLHLNDIKQIVATTTAQQTQKAVADNVRARGQRPAENGTGSQSGVIVKSDPSKFTAKDRAEIARRVQRGETIEL